MSLERRMQERQRQDKDLERYLGLRKNDPTRVTYGGKRYSRQDIEDLEAERLPWRKRKR